MQKGKSDMSFYEKSLPRLKGIFLLAVFSLIACKASAQYSMGNTGQLMIPTAEMQEAGTFMGGANFLPKGVTPASFDYPTMNYFVNMTFFPFVELTYRMTLLKMHLADGTVGYTNQDRSNTVRIRPLKEGKYYPAVVLGADDIFTETETKYWGSYYVVMTKGFNFHNESQLAVTAGWYFKTGKSATFNKGIFGGVRYTPSFCKELRLMAEYDTRGWNLGAAWRLWRHLSVSVFTHDFACVSGGLRYECTLIH